MRAAAVLLRRHPRPAAEGAAEGARGREAEQIGRSRETADIAIVLHSCRSEAELAKLIERTRAVGAISKSVSAQDFATRFQLLVGRRTSDRVRRD